MSSRFFAAGSDSDSESSSSSDDDLSYSEQEDQAPSDDDNDGFDDNDEDEDEDEEGDSGDEGKAGRARQAFLRDRESSDDSDDDGQKRVVQSARDKRWQEIEATANLIENKGKINDWVVISNGTPSVGFDAKLLQEFEKLNKLVAKDSSRQARRLYIRTLVNLEDLQNEAYEREKSAKKKMNATNARALNTFRQRIRKNNREYEAEIKKYREDPTSFDTESEDETKPQVDLRDELLGPDGQTIRGFIAPEDDEEGFNLVGRGGRAIIYTADGILKNLKMISEARGKRSTDRAEQIKILEELKKVAVTTYQKIRVLLALISGRFDYNPMALFMPIDQWTAYAPFHNDS
jgi:translation initiation factor 3 subunit C